MNAEDFLNENILDKNKTKEGHVKHFIHKSEVLYYMEKYLQDYKDKFLKGAEYQKNFLFTNDEVIDIIQKRLLSLGMFSSYTASEIWFNQYKK